MYDDLECPYCGKGNEVCHDDGAGYDEDEKHQMECRDCGKNFVFTTSISYSYEAQSAECLNDAEHEYKETNTIPRRYTRLRCAMCDHEKPLPKDHPYLLEPKFTI